MKLMQKIRPLSLEQKKELCLMIIDVIQLEINENMIFIIDQMRKIVVSCFENNDDRGISSVVNEIIDLARDCRKQNKENLDKRVLNRFGFQIFGLIEDGE